MESMRSVQCGRYDNEGLFSMEAHVWVYRPGEFPVDYIAHHTTLALQAGADAVVMQVPVVSGDLPGFVQYGRSGLLGRLSCCTSACMCILLRGKHARAQRIGLQVPVAMWHASSMSCRTGTDAGL